MSVGFLLLLLLLKLNLLLEIVQNNYETSMLLTALGFLLLYAVKSVTMMIPNSVLYIAVGAFFPTWLAILITYAGLTLSLSIGYFSGRKLGETKVYKLIAKQKKTMAFLKRNEGDLLPLCFITRLLALPFGLASLFFGALKIPFFKYAALSLLGVTPTMLPIVFSGAAISNPLSAAFIVPFGLGLAITLIIFVVYKKMTGLVT